MLRFPFLSRQGENRIARKLAFAPGASACTTRRSVGQRTHFSWSGLLAGIQPIKCIPKNPMTWSTACVQQHNQLLTGSVTNVVGLLLFGNVSVVRFVPQTSTQKCLMKSKEPHLHACLCEPGHARKTAAPAPHWPPQWSCAVTATPWAPPDSPRAPCFPLPFHASW